MTSDKPEHRICLSLVTDHLKRLKFKSQTCEQVQSYLDSYLNDELLIETNHDLQRHLENCRECAAEFEARARLQDALRQAVDGEPIPAALTKRIQERLRASQAINPFSVWGGRLSVASALFIVALCCGVWVAFFVWRGERESSQSAHAAHDSATPEQVRSVLKIGLGIHLHCAIEDKDANRYFGEIDAPYVDLLPLVTERFGENYEVVAAHHCEVEGREFAHYILIGREATLSLAVTKKHGAMFPSGAPIFDASGVPLYQDQTAGYQVAGFEAGEHFAFVVSDLRRDQNLNLASAIAPPLSKLLARSQSTVQRGTSFQPLGLAAGINQLAAGIYPVTARSR